MRSLWMLAASFFFAVMAAFTKFAAETFGAYELVFYRQLFATGALLLFVRMRGFTVRTEHLGKHVKRSLLGTAALLIWFYAIAHLPLGMAMTLNYTNPLWMAAIAALVAFKAGERLEWKLILCVFAGFIGITMVLDPEVGSSDFIPSMVGLTSGLLAALAQFQVRQMKQLKEPDWRIVFYFSVTGTIASLVCHFLFEGPMTALNLENGWPVLGMAVSGILAQLTMTRAWGGENVLLTSTLQYTAIVFAVLIGFIAFAEPVTLTETAGVAVIAAAGVAATLETRAKSVRRRTAKSPNS